MPSEAERERFIRELRTALIHLYDPSMLRNSVLVELLDVDQRGDAVSALRRTLINAIESLRPNQGTPQAARTWRVYQILRRRYTEQVAQEEVAGDLGISIRQLQREEKVARELLADHLWAAHHLETKKHHLAPSPTQADDQDFPADAPMPTRTQELEWLRSTAPAQVTEMGEVIREVLDTAQPLLASLQVTAAYLPQGDLPRLVLQGVLLRQALLNLVTAVIRMVPGGQVCLQCEAIPQHVNILIHGVAQRGASFLQPPEYAESVEMARQLIQFCQGALEIMLSTPEEVFSAKITIPAAEQVTVLVVDDNADALQLFQRYLSASRYRFLGAQDAQRAMALAEEQRPQIIVLDVMMPKQDGWALLGRFREHPRTRGIPIIVCTILPQEQLALMLGAADFIRKPVSRTTLLSALDRQLDRSLKTPG